MESNLTKFKECFLDLWNRISHSIHTHSNGGKVEYFSGGMVKKKLSQKAVAVIIALILAGVVFDSKYLQPSGKMSLFSVSQVEIEPQGGQVIDDKLRGCFWVVMLSVDEIDALEGRVEVIKKGQTGEFNGKTIENRKSLEIGINPEQAFFYRGARQEPTTITEAAYKSIHNKVTGQVWFDKSYHVAPLMS